MCTIKKTGSRRRSRPRSKTSDWRIKRETFFDLEAVEAALRAAVLETEAKLLETLLQGVGQGRRDQPLFCSCGAKMHSRGLEEKTIKTILGEVRFFRSRFECPNCRASRYPGDEELDVVNTSRSPGVRRMMARAGSRQTFKEAKADLKIYAGIEVSAKDVERVAEKIGSDISAWQAEERESLLALDSGPEVKTSIPVLYIEMDGTGVPMVREAVAGRKGKQPDGTARTREVKLGCVFTQTRTDDQGRPVRDPYSTSFAPLIGVETAEEFGARLEAEAIRRGLHEAEQVVVLGDGAIWIRGQVEHRFPQAQQIIDLYHAKEHVDSLVKLLFGQEGKKVMKCRLRWWTDLEGGLVEKIIEEAKRIRPDKGEIRKKIDSEINYLEENKERMRYAEF